MEEVISIIPCKVSAQMNDKLLDPIVEREVKSALFQMFPTKALVPMVSRRISFELIGTFVGRR
jgi:hypothetical protein